MTEKPRIVAVPVPGEGHVTPMMHLCVFLANRGFSVTFAAMATPPLIDIHSKIKHKGLWPPTGLDITLKELTSNTPLPENGFNFDLTLFHEYMETYRWHLEELVQEEILHGGCVIVLSDYLLGWCMDVAAKLGICGAILFTGSISWSWFEYHMCQLASDGIVPMQSPDEQLMEDKNCCVLGNSYGLRRSDIPWHLWNKKAWQDYTSNKLSRVVFAKAKWILVNSSEVLEEGALAYMKDDLGDKYITVGPLFLANDEKGPSKVGLEAYNTECLQWLDKKPPSSVLYIALGSIVTLSGKQLEEFASGLEASKHKFLWVIGSMGETEKVFFEKFSERTNEQGLVVTWSPQTQVLAHQSVGAFLSHCGWNSTQEALGNGKPILCWPGLFDQNTNCKLIIDDFKVGVKFAKNNEGVVDGKEIQEVIGMVMETEEGRELRKKAEEIGSKLREGIKCGQSRSNLEAFAQHIMWA